MSKQRHEFAGSSSGDKSSNKRSGKKSGLSSSSPYASGEDLTNLGGGSSDAATTAVNEDSVLSLLSDLGGKAYGPRVAARNTLTRLCEKFAIDAYDAESVQSAMQCCYKTVTNSKSGKIEVLASVQLAILLVICRGDDSALSDLPDAAAQILALVFASRFSDDESAATALAGFRLLHALHRQLRVDDKTTAMQAVLQLMLSSGVLGARKEIDEEARPSVEGTVSSPLGGNNRGGFALPHIETRAQYFLTRASMASATTEDPAFVELLVEQGLDSDSYDMVASAVEAVAIYSESHTDAFTQSHVAHLKRISTKEAGAEAKRNLLQLVRSFEASLGPDGVVPVETILFRGRDAEFAGFRRISLLSTLRGFVRDGLQAHLAHNTVVRRLFNLTSDLVSKVSREEKVDMAEDRRLKSEAKEESAIERLNARKQKQQARGHQFDDGADE